MKIFHYEIECYENLPAFFITKCRQTDGQNGQTAKKSTWVFQWSSLSGSYFLRPCLPLMKKFGKIKNKDDQRPVEV